ncbi:MAG: ATP-binding protein [Dysgonamonadaceae bacterium]|jgi:hypothetical protein|nr:ATP-binding protein [Dysgonamonadaceae bacterium]
MKDLPIGVQSFEDMRSRNYLYIDKTEHVHRIATTGKTYFLSRPRRFGKSLLISTLHELYNGRKDLFEGLYIYDKWDWTQQYPVIRLDWILISRETPEEIERSLRNKFMRFARENDIHLYSDYASDCLEELIVELHRKTGKKVVVLVDEYDAPILDAIGKPGELIAAIKAKVQGIYKILKGTDDHLEKIFLTGVSKFAGLSVFSALNNPKDITLQKYYSTICGYTQEELEANFAEYIDVLAKEMNMPRAAFLDEMRERYNGFSWDGQSTVYNPFSILRVFDERRFGNFWFNTATPAFLIKLLKKRNQVEKYTMPVKTTESVFGSYDPEALETIPLLFQTGYLTVKNIVFDNELIYTLEAPNKEVRKAFSDHLFKEFAGLSSEDMTSVQRDMIRQIRELDSEGFNRSLKAMIAHVPSILHIAEEKYYHSLFLIWLYALGFKIEDEVLTNIGRIDAVWRMKDTTVIAELKHDRQAPLERLLFEAEAQISNKKYYERYAVEGKRLILLAVAFSGKEAGCKITGTQKSFMR